jgi:perosamine synthetase
MSYLVKLKNIIQRFFTSPFFGFVKGHSDLTKKNIEEIESYIENEDQEIVRLFEREFSKKLGDGMSVSFASGRMGFYSLMLSLDIKGGDEVVIPGYTCSVMPNAIFRIGATPVYADINIENLGTYSKSVEGLITDNTRMVVAQHSFGIPCDIIELQTLCKERGIFLLEDCALTLGSKVNGTLVGNFGDASLFSFDHSKPINAMTGGIIYSRNNRIISSLQRIQQASQNLSINDKHSIFNDFVHERKFCNPEDYGKKDLVHMIKSILFKADQYLDEDYERTPSSSYPYPSRMPTFIAKLGLNELFKWEEEELKRKRMLKDFILFFTENGMKDNLPEAYFDLTLEIVPIRLIILHKQAKEIRELANSFLKTNWFWFTSPISECANPEDMGYVYGSCKQSEKACREIINLPCVHDEKYNMILFERTLSTIKKLKGESS